MEGGLAYLFNGCCVVIMVVGVGVFLAHGACGFNGSSPVVIGCVEAVSIGVFAVVVVFAIGQFVLGVVKDFFAEEFFFYE